MIDLDGTFAYSKMISLDFKAVSSLVVYPNPVSDKLFVKSSPELAISKIEVLDQAGKRRAQGTPGDDSVDVRSLESGISGD